MSKMSVLLIMLVGPSKGTPAQDPAANAVDSFFDDSCGSGYCIASINGGEYTDCVDNKCCPFASQDTLCNGECMEFGQSCCKETTVCGFHDRCLDDGTCIENDCEAMLKYDYELTGDVVTPDVPDCLTRSGCVSEIKEQGGMQCIRTKTSDGNNVASSVCETGGYENQCLSDDMSTCDFVNMDDSSSLGECEAQYLSAEGAAAAGMLIGGALIAVIVVPILAVLICGGILLGVCIWCCCCKDKKKPPATNPS